jgi:hypothetical protein
MQACCQNPGVGTRARTTQREALVPHPETTLPNPKKSQVQDTLAGKLLHSSVAGPALALISWPTWTTVGPDESDIGAQRELKAPFGKAMPG